jgi:hypothetical protein
VPATWLSDKKKKVGMFETTYFFLFWKLGECLQSQRWNRKLGRPMMGTEMMASMGLPVTAKLAKECGVVQPDVSQLSQSAKARLSKYMLE